MDLTLRMPVLCVYMIVLYLTKDRDTHAYTIIIIKIISHACHVICHVLVLAKDES